jgi:protein arginine N-methyltransferase 1
MALRAGAGRVYAIDLTSMLGVAKEVLARAGMDHRCTFINDLSQRVELPERVDLVVCDQVGFFGFEAGILDSFRDARQRFLKPHGKLIPERIRLRLAAFESVSEWNRINGWRAANVDPDFHWLRKFAVNSTHAARLGRDQVLCAPAFLGDIDLYKDNPDFFSWSADLRIERDGVIHGVAGWFECELAEDIWMTNSPLADEPIQRPQSLMPIDEPMLVHEGDEVEVTIIARPFDRLVSWKVEFPRTGRRFSHSTWEGMVLTQKDLMQTRPGRIPHLSRDGAARMTVLGYCDGRRTAREIQEAVLREHPGLFPSQEEISRFVTQVLAEDAD